MDELFPRDISDGAVSFYPRFVPLLEADVWLQTLLGTLAWRQEPITIFGKRVLQPRLTAWHADASVRYSYSGHELTRADWTPLLSEIRGRVEAATGERFNSVLCNLYRDGSDSMGWHSDDEAALGRNPCIASLTLGAARRFLLRRKDNPTRKEEFLLGHGSFLVMSGALQHHWQHAVPRTVRCAEPRLNLTFRTIVR